jgi:hypothetical protein
MVSVPANNLLRPYQLFMGNKHFTPGAYDEPERNSSSDKRIEECATGEAQQRSSGNRRK